MISRLFMDTLYTPYTRCQSGYGNIGRTFSMM